MKTEAEIVALKAIVRTLVWSLAKKWEHEERGSATEILDELRLSSAESILDPEDIKHEAIGIIDRLLLDVAA